MFIKPHQPPWRRRLPKWAGAVAVIALLLWSFEYSNHVHRIGDPQKSSHIVEFCGVCAGLQVGAGPLAVALFVPRAQPITPGTGVLVSALSNTSPLAYRSRAPPRI